MTPDIQRTLSDPSASDWLKASLLASLSRDPVDAANDADALASMLAERADRVSQAANPAPWQVCHLTGRNDALDSPQIAERLNAGWQLLAIQSGAQGVQPVAYFRRRRPSTPSNN
jgi:hypothetical protein